MSRHPASGGELMVLHFAWFIFLFFCLGTTPCASQIIGEIRVDGAYSSDPAEILKIVQTPIGASLASPSTRRSISEDLRRIAELDVYDPISLQASVEGPDALKTLIFSVREFPLVADVEYVGNTKYKKKRLDSELEFDREERVFFRPGLIEQFQEKLEKFYYSKGFSNVFIEGREKERTAEGVILEFVIESGNKLKLQEVGFDGNVAFTEEELKEHIKTRPKAFYLFRRKYDEDIFEQDIERLKFHYQSHGFLEATVEKGTQKLVRDDKRLEVDFAINEGPRYILGDIDIQGAEIFDRAELLAPITIQPHQDYLDRPQLLRDLQAVRDLYWNQGYVFVDFEPEIIPDPETRFAHLHLHVNENPRFRLRNIRIEGVGAAADGSLFKVPMETKDHVIEREFLLAEGDVLDWSRVRETERELINLQFFEREEGAFPPRLKHGFQIERIPESEEADLLLQLEETNTGFITFRGGFSTDFGPSVGAEFKDRNAFGRGWLYSIAADVGSRRSSADFTFYNPRVNNSNYSTRFRLFARSLDQIGGREFGENRFGGSVSGGRHLSPDGHASIQYRLERVKIEDIEDDFILRDPEDANANLVDRLFTEEANVTSAVSLRLSRDTRDYVFFPTSGLQDIVSVEVAGAGGDNDFVGVSGTFDRYLALRPKLVLALRAHLAFSNPFGNTEDLPLQERFFLGGANSLRGFRTGGVSPFRVVQRRVTDIDGNEIFRDDEILIGGEAEWFTNLELRYRFNDTVQSVAFLDAGSVFEETSDFGFDEIRVAAGTGLRLTLFGNALVRLDLGFPLAKEDEDETQNFQFNFGANF